MCDHENREADVDYCEHDVPDYLTCGACAATTPTSETYEEITTGPSETLTPVPSEVAETTAGEREACVCPPPARHLPGCPPAAEPDAGEVEALVLTIAQALNRHALARPSGETTALCVCLTWSIDRTEDRAADERAYEVHVATHVAARLAALLDRVRREEGARIAQAIEAQRDVSQAPNYRAGFDVSARIARAASVGRGEGL